MRATLLVLAWAATVLAGCGVSKSQANALLADQARTAGQSVKEALSARMVDPRATRWGAIWENMARICGSFDPRDSAGTYVGSKRFVGRRGGSILIEGVSTSGAFAAEWEAYCNHAHHLLQDGDRPGPPVHPMTDEERAAEQAAFSAGPPPKGRGKAVEI